MRLFLSGRYLKWFVIVELLGLVILGVITGFLGFIAEMTLSAMLGYGLIKRSGEPLGLVSSNLVSSTNWTLARFLATSPWWSGIFIDPARPFD